MKKLGWIGISVILVFSLFMTACGKEEVKPAAIDHKTDKCDVCNMSVANNQFATEVALENGKILKFDDIGCMFKWEKEHEGKTVEKEFVRDFTSKEWVEANKAYFVYDKEVRTPMAYNMISFKEKKDAEEYATKNKGTNMTYDQLKKHDWHRNSEMMHHQKQQHHGNGNM